MVTCPLCKGSTISPLESEFGNPPVPRNCPVCLGVGEIGESHGSSKGIEVTCLLIFQATETMIQSFSEFKDWCLTVNQKLAYLKEKIDAL